MDKNWKHASKELPNGSLDNFRLLMCSLYVHSGAEPEVEYYYETGYFLAGKFYKDNGEQYQPDYWSVYNEPQANKILNQYETTQIAALEDAISIAALAHKGQTDKAGAAYILHPLRMMMKMKSEAAMMVAVLHDVVEDSDWTIEELRKKGFSEEILTALDCVTNRENESYEDFIERASKNSIAREVKIADLEDNMDIKRIGELNPKDLERLQKYHRSRRGLINGR